MTNNDLECLRMTYNDLQWHLGRSCALKKLENAEKVKKGPTDQPTNQPAHGPTKRGVESRSTRLKRKKVLKIKINRYRSERQIEIES